MNAGVDEDATAGFFLGERPALLGAENLAEVNGGAETTRRADPAGLQAARGFEPKGIVAFHKTDGGNELGMARGGLGHEARVFQVVGERFLREDVEAALQAGNSDRAVGELRRRNNHAIEAAFVFKERLQRSMERRLDPHALNLRPQLRVHVHQRGHLYAGDRAAHRSVHHAHFAQADHGEAHGPLIVWSTGFSLS